MSDNEIGIKKAVSTKQENVKKPGVFERFMDFLVMDSVAHVL